MTTKTEYDPVTSIRMPVDLKQAVMARAKAEGRSFSQQVNWYLRQHVTVADDAKPAAPKKRSSK